jgi:hypothetical protein
MSYQPRTSNRMLDTIIRIIEPRWSGLMILLVSSFRIQVLPYSTSIFSLYFLTKVNLCYYEDEWAADALTAFTSEAAYYEGHDYGLTDPRPGKTHPDKPGINLIVRFAKEKDRKVKGARDMSRYYLLHGEPEDRRPYAKSAFWDDDKDLFPELGDDLFPDRVRDRTQDPRLKSDVPSSSHKRSSHSRKTRNDEDAEDGEDLFPDRDLGARLDIGQDRGRVRNRSRSPGRRRRSDHETPSGTWTKGELLKPQSLRERISARSRSRSRSPSRRRRRGRRTAADHF